MEQPVVIITGGAQGIGKVCADLFLQQGYRVAAFDIDEEAGRESQRELGADYLFVLCDVSNEAQVKAAIQTTVDRWKRIDALINNAGISRNQPLEKLEYNDWKKVINTNLGGTFLCSKYAVPHLKKQRGAIVNICSTRAYMSEPDTEAYSASKGGILALTHALAMSLGPDIRVNSISPGWIDVTPYQKSSALDPAALRPVDHRQHPAGRVGTPSDIARMAVFLIDGKNDFVTGQDFIVDGGMTRKMIYE